eukprot:jgi/Chlat1/3216/Chrsp22S03420
MAAVPVLTSADALLRSAGRTKGRTPGLTREFLRGTRLHQGAEACRHVPASVSRVSETSTTQLSSQLPRSQRSWRLAAEGRTGSNSDNVSSSGESLTQGSAPEQLEEMLMSVKERSARAKQRATRIAEETSAQRRSQAARGDARAVTRTVGSRAIRVRGDEADQALPALSKGTNAVSANGATQDAILLDDKADGTDGASSTLEDDGHTGNGGIAVAAPDAVYSQTQQENEERRQAQAHEQVATEERARVEAEEHAQFREQVVAAAAANSDQNFFTLPESLKAGSSATIFYNIRKSGMSFPQQVIMQGAFNDWSWNALRQQLQPTDVLQEDRDNWLSSSVYVPEEAYNFKFVLTDGGAQWDNNYGRDYVVDIEGDMTPEGFDRFLLQKAQEAEELRLEEERTRQEVEARLRAEQQQKELEERLVRAAQERIQSEKDAAVAQAAAMKEKALGKLAAAHPWMNSVYYVDPFDVQAGGTCTLYYNRNSRSLKDTPGDLFLHVGYNNWVHRKARLLRMQMAPEIQTADGSWWWKVQMEVPKDAFLINFVLSTSDQPGQGIYDNNNGFDFQIAVQDGPSPDEFYGQLAGQLMEDLRIAREKAEAEAQVRREKRDRKKGQLKALAKDLFLRQQRRMLYTEPSVCQAGEPVTVFYNPDATVMAGKRDVWIRGSWNRWSHRMCFIPQKMEPIPNSTHLKSTVNVPRDAYVMDFVFSDTGDLLGGFYDNNHGLDYHVPVFGSLRQEPPLHVVHVAVEMAPIAKVGGLGDVVTGLARAVKEVGHKVEVILPKYDVLDYTQIHNLIEVEAFAWGGTQVKVWFGEVEDIPVYFMEPLNGMVWAKCVYGRPNDAQRFGFFCHAALEWLQRSGRKPNILHCHDWSSAPVARLYSQNYMNSMPGAKVIFTIHNLNYGTNLIGEAMAHCQMATTVSPTYRNEVSGQPVIAPHVNKFYGIRNGIDIDLWDPADDKFLPMLYTSDELVEGKRKAREELRRRLDLDMDENKPVIGIVTRLTAQKGIHLIKHAIWRTLDRSGQVVLLGSAPDPRVQNEFVLLARQLSAQNNHNARLYLSYDEPLSHLIYAGSDIVIVPSMFEPCGLTQLIAMRYGAIPVVRRTGGLNDTVLDVDHDGERANALCLQPNGFSFDGTDAPGLDYAMNRAMNMWYSDREKFHELQKTVMDQDWSWNLPALDYIELYYGALKGAA